MTRQNGGFFGGFHRVLGHSGTVVRPGPRPDARSVSWCGRDRWWPLLGRLEADGPTLASHRGAMWPINRRIGCQPAVVSGSIEGMNPGSGGSMGSRSGRCSGRSSPRRLPAAGPAVTRSARWGRLPGGASSGKFGYPPHLVDEWWLCWSDPRRLALGRRLLHPL